MLILEILASVFLTTFLFLHVECLFWVFIICFFFLFCGVKLKKNPLGFECILNPSLQVISTDGTYNIYSALFHHQVMG